MYHNCSRPGVLAARSLVRPHWGLPSSSLGVARVPIVVSNVGILRFLGILLFPQFHSSATLLFLNPHFMTFHILTHSFTYHPSPHSWLEKKFGLTHFRCKFMTVDGWRWNWELSMCTSIGLWALANIVQGIMGREWLITILRPKA